jgi:alpha-amylase
MPLALVALLIAVLALAPPGAVAKNPRHAKKAQELAMRSLRAPLTDQRFYFVMADRFENGTEANDDGGLGSDRLVSGFDPTAKGFYHGGDLQGIRARLDYLKGLGTTSIWLTPSFKNRAVQLEDGPSAGYHGYWITDFTQIDPHLGTNEDLAALIADAHAKGMKVFFDIITNHTADVIQYDEGARTAYVDKDVVPYKDASGTPFDDRDYAGTNDFPALDPDVSFPYHPFVPPGLPSKVPDWLNDPIYYHNRGNTTFTGEDSLYGDFFGLDDLFTEHPRVVRGMIDIYEKWIRDFGIDGFRIDTVKHVNDEFWQQFGPEVLDYARAQGKRDFFMFGEVFDLSRPFTSHFTTHDRLQAVLDFPFQAAAENFAAKSGSADDLRQFFTGDDWYTDADSNAYQLPTFLGNHDMGRIGLFVKRANPGATDAELLARDRLAHELMYFSRGNPVVYYGDEQGFVGDGGDQLARQDMFPSKVPEYNDDDLIGTDATTAESNFDPSHPLYRTVSRLSAVTARHPALRNGTQQSRYADEGPGVFAFTRLDRRTRHEYVVALNDAETAKTASIPTAIRKRTYDRVYGSGPRHARTDKSRRMTLTVPALSAVVYESNGRVPHSKAAPSIDLVAPTDDVLDRAEVRADVGGSGYYDVTFLARVGDGDWQPIGTDDNSPYRVFHDVADLEPGTQVQYRAVVLDDRGHTRTSAARTVSVAPPTIEITRPANDGAKVRDRVEIDASTVPDHADYVVTFERRVDGGAWTVVGTDSSSPSPYQVFDDISAFGEGTTIEYRATLDYGSGSVTSAARSVTVAGTVTTARVHYHRTNGDYTDWGLHLWGDAIADSVTAAVAWDKPWPWSTTDDFGVVFEIPLKDDTKAVNFIVHLPSGDSVPDTREPGGDRSFTPIEHPEIWLLQGDPTVYFSPPPT